MTALTSDFEEAVTIIKRNYGGAKSTDVESLTNSAITSMLHELDPHSNYYNAAEYQDLLGEHESEYSGTGSSIAGFVVDGVIETFVLSTFPGSPAARAGMRFGDRIVAVDGRRVSGESPDNVRDAVRGKRGSTVRVIVERADSGRIESIELRRDRVHEPAVPKGFLVNKTTGYIDLTNGFSNSTFPELEVALTELNRQGMRSLILDLRGNGGGILEQAVKVAEKFLPPGTTIVSQRGRYSDDTRVWKAAKASNESMPLVLLVDENTASASEVLAGALQDNDRALILGERTFGKGLVQSVLSLPEGGGLTLTAARYYTPAGRSIQRDYTHTGSYDYHRHRVQAAEIDQPVFAAKTITNRVVYGGDGILPDEKGSSFRFTDERIKLLDPIFLFVREMVSERSVMAGSESQTLNLTFRQHVLFDESPVDEMMLSKFESFATSNPSWAKLKPSIASEKEFIRNMLGYYLMMGNFGPDSARRIQIENDPGVRQAVLALPRAAKLAAQADVARNSRQKQKGSLSLVLSEQR